MAAKPAAVEALERMLDVIREEAIANPAFAARILRAAGIEVTDAQERGDTALDPILLAVPDDPEAFKQTFAAIPEKELKILLKSYGLATEVQIKTVKGPGKQAQLIDLMWQGARRKLHERSVR